MEHVVNMSNSQCGRPALVAAALTIFILCYALRYVTKRCGAHYGATLLIWEYGDEELKKSLRTILGIIKLAMHKYWVGIAPDIGQFDFDDNLLVFYLNYLESRNLSKPFDFRLSVLLSQTVCEWKPKCLELFRRLSKSVKNIDQRSWHRRRQL